MAEARDAGIIETATPGASWRTMLSIGLYAPDGVTEIDLTEQDYGFGDLHAVRDGQYLHVPSGVFWPWVADLVGMTVVDRRTERRMGFLADFDYHAALSATYDATFGLEVAGGSPAHPYQVALGLDEFWAALERLVVPS
jgi:hypothetical protein